MEKRRIKIEEKFSKKKYNLCVCLFAIPTILIIVAIFLYGYNWFLQFLFLFILGVDIFIPVILPSVHNEKYLSEIQITQDFIFLIFKIQDKVVKKIEIIKTDIESVKIDLNIKKEHHEKNPPYNVCLSIMITLFNGEKITNCECNDLQHKMKLESWVEEGKAQIKDKKKLEHFLNTVENRIEELIYTPQFLETRNYSFIFDFLVCEQILPNCKLNIKTSNPRIQEEIEYYKKYGKRPFKRFFL